MTYSRNNAHRGRVPGQTGLSLVELMVAVVVLAVLMVGIAELMVTNTKNATATGSLARIEETGRTAIQLISSDIRRAGYLGGNMEMEAEVSTISGSLDLATPAMACVANTTAWARMVTQRVIGLDDTNDAFTCITDDEYLQGDVLTLRFADSPELDVSDMVATRPYLRATVVEGRIFAGADANDPNNVMVADSARNYTLVAHTYFVGNTDRECQGDAIPALFRKAISDTGLPESNELLAGVEHLQFRYLEGSRYRNAGEVTDWSNVDAVETTVLVRSECPESGFTNTRSFTMGNLGAAYGPEDGYRRQVFSTTTQIRN